jgi:hypothetical protein
MRQLNGVYTQASNRRYGRSIQRRLGLLFARVSVLYSVPGPLSCMKNKKGSAVLIVHCPLIRGDEPSVDKSLVLFAGGV